MVHWSVAVVIPAHNESETIAACIRSVLEAASHCERIRSLWIVIAADACSDDTGSKASRAMGAHGEVLTVNEKRAGAARRLGTQRALAHFSKVPCDSIWVACTDADTRVRADWLATQLDAADAGAQGLAGIIELRNASPRVRQVHEAHYPLYPDGTHPHVHGANLAFRADAYIDAGGWRDIALAEDHCLWNRLLSRGWRVQSSTKSVVLTSARLDPRAAGGFGTTLKERLESYAAHFEPVSTC